MTALAATYFLPFGDQYGGPLSVEGSPDGSYGANGCYVSRHYFDVFRIPLRRGRIFSEQDNAKAQPITLVNETLAGGGDMGFALPGRIRWHDGDPLGQRVTLFKGLGLPLEDHTRQIVGVIGDMRDTALNKRPRSTVFMPMDRITDDLSAVFRSNQQLFWTIRTKSDPLLFSAAIERELSVASGGLPVGHGQVIMQRKGDSTARQRFNTILLSIFAAIAVLLAAIGIYGVMAYKVEEQTKEIGIRLALGASPSRILTALLSQGMRLAISGVAIGLLSSLAVMRFLRTLLFGVEPSDPMTLVTTSVFLGVVALASIYIPARRATRIDPVQTLRWE